MVFTLIWTRECGVARSTGGKAGLDAQERDRKQEQVLSRGSDGAAAKHLSQVPGGN